MERITQELMDPKYLGLEVNGLPQMIEDKLGFECREIIYDALYQVDVFNLDFCAWMREQVIAIISSR